MGTCCCICHCFHAALALGPVCETLLVCSLWWCNLFYIFAVQAGLVRRLNTWTVATFLAAGVQRSGAA